MIQRTRVVVVGAGLAGLVAAWRLVKQGCEVLLTEGRAEIGGRVRSVLVNDRTWVEVGANHIASYHHDLRKLCTEFDVSLALSPRVQDCAVDPIALLSQGSRIGATLATRILQDLDDVIERCVAEASGAAIEPSMAQIDVHDLITEYSRSSYLARYFSDLPRGAQSAWALLALIRGAGGADFFADTEAYFAPGGMAQLSDGLGASIGASRIQTGWTLRHIAPSSHPIELVFATMTGTRRVYADVAILAVPPRALSTLPEVSQASALIGSLTNNREITLLGRGETLATALPRLLLGDGAVCRASLQLVSNPQHDTRIHLTVRADHAASSDSPEALYRSVADVVWPFTVSDMTTYEFGWASLPEFGGTYGAFRPGQVVSEHAEVIQFGRVLIAGDLVVPRFAGYMEGAVRSGQAAAAMACSLLSGG